MHSSTFASTVVTRRMQRSDKKNWHPFVKALFCVIEITPTNLTLCLQPNYTAKKVIFRKRMRAFTFFFFLLGKWACS